MIMLGSMIAGRSGIVFAQNSIMSVTYITFHTAQFEPEAIASGTIS
jgi:hypothetical protein